jgi:hypothetical protein
LGKLLLAPQPAKPTAAAQPEQITALEEYYKPGSEKADRIGNKTRCPTITIDPAVQKEFPNMAQTLAVLRYVLAQNVRPDTSAFSKQPPPIQLSPEAEDMRRARLAALLDDPALQLKFVPPKNREQAIADVRNKKSVAAANTRSANVIELGMFAGGSDADGTPAHDPFRLATTILHEMVHVDQIRNEHIRAGHGDAAIETPAYAWEHSMPGHWRPFSIRTAFPGCACLARLLLVAIQVVPAEVVGAAEVGKTSTCRARGREAPRTQGAVRRGSDSLSNPRAKTPGQVRRL